MKQWIKQHYPFSRNGSRDKSENKKRNKNSKSLMKCKITTLVGVIMIKKLKVIFMVKMAKVNNNK
jgi:hypothetical protein